MYAQQLVIHEDDGVRQEAAKAIERALGRDEAFVIKAANFRDALEYLRAPGREWSLIVAGTTAPESALSGVTPGDTGPACEFIRAVRRSQAIPLIALTTVDDGAVRELLKNWEQTALVLLDFAELEARARALRQRATDPGSLELEITFRDKQEGFWRIRRRGAQSFSDNGPLKINADLLRDVVNYSESVARLRDGEEWWRMLFEVSQKLQRLLFDADNFRMVRTFFENVQAVGGLANSQILFTMTPQGQKAMVEALREDPTTATKDFWMLRAPIVRQYEFSGGRTPLFTDPASRREKVNCLFINADPDAGTLKSDGWSERCDSLDQIAAEVDDIVERLQRAPKDPYGIGEVESLDLSIDPADSMARLMRKLAERTWHIVHFAGHGVLDKNKAPALVLSAKSGVVLPFARLATALTDTRFLFLSACQTGSTDFITKAIEHSVPVVVGYQWKVDDVEASEFAKKFYECLFDPGQPTFKSIYRSLVASRQAAFNRAPEGRTWASPVLLTQQVRDLRE